MSATSRTKPPQHGKSPNMRVRRFFMSALLGGVLVVCVLAGLVTAAAVSQQHATVAAAAKPALPLPVLASVHRVPAVTETRPAAHVVVLAYHALGDGCAAAEPTCRSKDFESVSADQFKAEMAWLYVKGYHTVTMDQYLRWLGNQKTPLPPKPILLVDDNGDSDFLLGAEAVLYHYRFTVTADLDTGFNMAATTGYCLPKRVAPNGNAYNVQQNCGGPNTWNATWSQLEALSPQVYNYVLEAGPSGHYVQAYDKDCTAYYACEMPGETASAYEARVEADMHAGFLALAKYLPGRVSNDAWVVPYSDLGYGCSKQLGCAYEHYTGAHKWLIRYAQAHFAAIFVQDPYRNGLRNERFRFEVHNTTTLRQFTFDIRYYTRHGDWKW
jgi:hypothetical protein